jgi:hypothetical protein
MAAPHNPELYGARDAVLLEGSVARLLAAERGER